MAHLTLQIFPTFDRTPVNPAAASSIISNCRESIRKKLDIFRILIIGRANAGKTTILQKVCNTIEDPEIYSSKGDKIDVKVLEPCAMRGSHNIDHEMIFRSSPGFIFHDSRGFEAGGVGEVEKVKSFIAERSRRKILRERIHAIWYCIPMDDSRPFTMVERSFFSEYGTESVPVLLLFTKFDALDDTSFEALENEGYSWESARNEAPFRATAEFERTRLGIIYEWKFPPKDYIYLRDMDKPGTSCNQLVAQTAASLDNIELQNLFVSTQRNNLELSVNYAVKEGVLREIIEAGETTLLKWLLPNEVEEAERVQKIVLSWFPHIIWVSWRRKDSMFIQAD